MARYRLATGLSWEVVADELVIGTKCGDVVVVNAPALCILQSLIDEESPNQEESAREALCLEHGFSEKTAGALVRRTLGRLRQAKVVVPASEPSCRTVKRCSSPTRRTFVEGMLAAGVSLLGADSILGSRSAAAANLAYADEFMEQPTEGSLRYIDSLGQAVEVTEQVEKIVPFGPLARAMIESIDPDLVANATDRGAYASMLDRASDASDVSEDVRGSAEALSAYEIDLQAPDLILDVATSKERLRPQGKQDDTFSGVPIMHLIVGPGHLANAYRLMGRFLNRNERCNEIADFIGSIDVTMAQISELASLGQKKRVYFGGGTSGLVPKNAPLFDSILALSALERVGESNVDAGSMLSISQVAESSPDIVILALESDDEEPDQEEIVLNLWEKTVGSSGAIIKIAPSCCGVSIFDSPLLSMTLGALWLATQAYPEYASFDYEEIKERWLSVMIAPSSADINQATVQVLSSQKKALAIADGLKAIEANTAHLPSVELISAQSLSGSVAYMSSGIGGAWQEIEDETLYSVYLLIASQSVGSLGHGALALRKEKMRRVDNDWFGIADDMLLFSFTANLEDIISDLGKGLYEGVPGSVLHLDGDKRLGHGHPYHPVYSWPLFCQNPRVFTKPKPEDACGKYLGQNAPDDVSQSDLEDEGNYDTYDKLVGAYVSQTRFEVMEAAAAACVMERNERYPDTNYSALNNNCADFAIGVMENFGYLKVKFDAGASLVELQLGMSGVAALIQATYPMIPAVVVSAMLNAAVASSALDGKPATIPNGVYDHFQGITSGSSEIGFKSPISPIG